MEDEETQGRRERNKKREKRVDTIKKRWTKYNEEKTTR